MTIQLIDFRAAVTTDVGTSEYYTRFASGLNVLRARNSWGKSTMLHGMIFAVGLEGAFTASQGVPLTPALTQALDLPSGRKTVIESFTAVTIRNARGQYLRSRRFARSLDFDHKLVQVWMAPTEAELDSTEVSEYFVRHPGSAVRERGFHQLLAQFLGCDLPTVPAHGGGESLLYLELLLPLLFVEQKFGWSGIAPRVRSNLQAREPLKRGVEYLLGLSTLDRINAKNRLRDQLADIRKNWDVAVRALKASTSEEGQRISFLSEEPVGPLKLRPPIIEAFVDGKWLPAEEAMSHWGERLKPHSDEVPTVEARTDASRAELEEAEQQAIRLGVDVRRSQDQRVLLAADHSALKDRHSAIEADRRRLEDAKLVVRFGGEAKISLLADNRCPTCDQDVDNRHTAFGSAFPLDENISFLKAESEVVLSMLVAATARMESLDATIAAMQSSLGSARQAIRLLRDELTLPSSMPSVAQLQADLVLRGKIRSIEVAQSLAEDTYAELVAVSGDYQLVRSKLEDLKGGDLDDTDKATIADFQRTFRGQLRTYGLRSISPDEVTISPESLLPDNGGFDLSFTSADMDAKVSASDTIRTKWAYVTSLYEVASRTEQGRHPGLLVLDEPRQQEVDRKDVMAFIERLSASSASGQIIYVTSEDVEMVTEALEGREVHFLPSVGNHLFSS